MKPAKKDGGGLQFLIDWSGKATEKVRRFLKEVKKYTWKKNRERTFWKE